MIIMTEDEMCYIEELTTEGFVGVRHGQPVHGIILEDEEELFFNLDRCVIRSYYELDTLVVLPAVFETIIVG